MKLLRSCLALAFLAVVPGFSPPPARADNPQQAVISAEEAKTIAQKWASETKLAGLQLGEVKTFSLVFTVDLIEEGEPDVHSNHLIIRKDDGFASLVYPAHDAPKLSHQHRLGLEGLSGMTGMTGMSGATQNKRTQAIRHDGEARRHVAAWLKSNGVGGHYTLEDVVSMNGVFLVDLHDPKTHKLLNQAVARGIDGYVSLIRPTKEVQSSLPNFSPTRR